MKSLKVILPVATLMLLISGCGRMTSPEILGMSGDYKIVTTLPLAGYAQDVVIKDTIAYVTLGQGGLGILSIANPENPHVISYLTNDVRGYSSRIVNIDTILYIADGSFGLTVVDIGSPETANVLLSNVSIKPAKQLFIKNNFLFSSISEQGVRISDISDPTYPDIRGKISTSGYAQGLITDDAMQLLFVATGEVGLSIFDISAFNEGFPETVLKAWLNLPGYAEDVAISESKSIAYVACGEYGLQIVDYSDITNLKIISSYSNGGYASKVVVKNDKVYLNTQKRGLLILDVSDSVNPKLSGEIKTTSPQQFYISDKYIFLADEIEGLVVISQP